MNRNLFIGLSLRWNVKSEAIMTTITEKEEIGRGWNEPFPKLIHVYVKKPNVIVTSHITFLCRNAESKFCLMFDFYCIRRRRLFCPKSLWLKPMFSDTNRQFQFSRIFSMNLKKLQNHFEGAGIPLRINCIYYHYLLINRVLCMSSWMWLFYSSDSVLFYTLLLLLYHTLSLWANNTNTDCVSRWEWQITALYTIL